MQTSDKQQSPTYNYTPKSSEMHQKLKSTISIVPKSPTSIVRGLSLSSDDDNDKIVQNKLPTTPIFQSLIGQQSSLKTNSSLPINNTTSMDVAISDRTISFLSEEDDDNNISTSVIEQSPSKNLKMIPSLEYNQSQSCDKQSTNDMFTSELSNEKTQTNSSISLDFNHIQIVLRLLNILTQIPISLKPLRLIRHRKKIPRKQITTLIRHQTDSTQENETVIPMLEQSTFMIENDTADIQISESQSLMSTEEQQILHEDNDSMINERQKDQLAVSMDEHSMSTNMMLVQIPENQISTSMDEQSKSIEEYHTSLNDIPENQVSSSSKTQQEFLDESTTDFNQIRQDQVTLSTEESLISIPESTTVIERRLEDRDCTTEEERAKTLEENSVFIDELLKEKSISVENSTTMSEIHEEQVDNSKLIL